MADKRCENGHFIDENWDICPYCPQDESEPEIPVVRPRAVEPSPARSLALASAPPAAAPAHVADQTGRAGGGRSSSAPSLAAVQLNLHSLIRPDSTQAMMIVVLGAKRWSPVNGLVGLVALLCEPWGCPI